MRFIVLFALLIVIAVTAAGIPDVDESSDGIDRAVILLDGVQKTASLLPLLGKAAVSLFKGVKLVLKGLKFIVNLFALTGPLFGLLSGDLSSVTKALTGLLGKIG